MAGRVIVRDEEYRKLTSTLKQVHTDNLQAIDEVLKQIRSLNRVGGGLYIRQFTGKINMLIGDLSGLRASMESVYGAAEEVITSFSTVIDDYDTM